MLSGMVKGIASSDMTGLSASDSGFSVLMWTKHDFNLIKDSALFSIKQKDQSYTGLSVNYDSVRVYGHQLDSEDEYEKYQASDSQYRFEDFAMFEMRFDPQFSDEGVLSSLGAEVKVHKYEDLSGEMTYQASDLVSAAYFENYSIDPAKGVEFLFGASKPKIAGGVNSYYFNGNIRDIMLLKGHLSPKEAESLYEMRNPAKICIQDTRLLF